MRQLVFYSTIFTLFLQIAHGIDLRRTVESYVAAHEKEILEELVALLSIPSVASDRENIRRKAELLRVRFEQRGLEARLLETEGNPLVFAELRVPKAEHTLLIYAHYDGQPADPGAWHQPDPFRPLLRTGKVEDGASAVNNWKESSDLESDWRLYARSASDDTGPIVGLLAALDALKSAGLPLTSNLKVILDGEEEAGSPSLVPAIRTHRNLLEADLMLILDGPIHPSGRPTLVYGARGIVTVSLTVYGPSSPVHSGHYGNWVPNPAFSLARLLASMKDEDGRVTIQGFYEGVEIPQEDLDIMREVPDDPEALKRHFGLAATETVGNSLQEARNFPSLNVRGLASGWVQQEVRTIIPDQALAELDIRLVPETPPKRMVDLLTDHITKQGYFIVADPPDDELRNKENRIIRVEASSGTQAYRTSFQDPKADKLYRALRTVLEEDPIRIRTSGGTVPISPFIEVLGFPAVSMPIVNFDNHQHSPNENLRLGNLFEGIVSIATALRME